MSSAERTGAPPIERTSSFASRPAREAGLLRGVGARGDGDREGRVAPHLRHRDGGPAALLVARQREAVEGAAEVVAVAHPLELVLVETVEARSEREGEAGGLDVRVLLEL